MVRKYTVKPLSLLPELNIQNLEFRDLDKFTGAGVYYGAASVEAHACKNEIVYIVGGGNSACQAAMHICKFAKEVNILIRRESIKNTAANYLAESISKTPNIKVLPHTEVAQLKVTKF